jgi:large subunit ribosomal protein LP0
VTNVGSSQIGEMRKDFRKRGRFLFGKNTLIRKCIREYMKNTGNRKLMTLLDLCRGNSGFFFTKGDVGALRKEITARQVQQPAKSGAVAPIDVFVPPGPTGMEPTQTTFFQAMNIGTRINRGQIDITDEVHLIRQGEKVTPSQSSLLTKLNIKPFFYGMKVKSVYEDGNAYDASALDITQQDVANGFLSGLRQVAALSFGINHPTLATVPHSTLNAYKKVLAFGLSLETYSWENLDLVKKVLENPGAFAAVTAAPTTTTTGPAKGQTKVEEAPADDKEKESSAAPKDPFGGGDESGADSD